ATVCDAVQSTGRAVVIAEASGFASVASEIAARVSERCFHFLAAPVRRVTGFDIPYPPPAYEHFQLPHAERVLDAVDTLQWEDTCAPFTCRIWAKARPRPVARDGWSRWAMPSPSISRWWKWRRLNPW